MSIIHIMAILLLVVSLGMIVGVVKGYFVYLKVNDVVDRKDKLNNITSRMLMIMWFLIVVFILLQ